MKAEIGAQVFLTLLLDLHEVGDCSGFKFCLSSGHLLRFMAEPESPLPRDQISESLCDRLTYHYHQEQLLCSCRHGDM